MLLQRVGGRSSERASEPISEAQDSTIILKVCDLGQCRRLSEGGNLTEYVSTRWYRAPEILVGSRTYDKSVDIWALGCMIPELLSGKPLFPGNSNFEALAYVIKTMGNSAMTEGQVKAFYANPDFANQPKIPQIKRVIPLDVRVPELRGDDLDFVSQCLSMDPAKRPTA